MSDGRIYYSEHIGNYYLKMVGDVRVTLCASLSTYIERIFNRGDLQSLVIDLMEARAVDSTALGFMAKLALYARGHAIERPLLLLEDPSLKQLIEGMGFDEVFSVDNQFPDTPDE